MQNTISLKYGCNPNQQPASIFLKNQPLPITVLNGNPGYINFLDALNGWQLVKELKEATGYPAATSFKHVSPAGAAIGLPLNETLEKMYFTSGKTLTPLACAYARARGADRMSSFGDWIALSDRCDKATALLIAPEVSDGIIAPGYDEDALEILKKKRKGKYNIVEIDSLYEPEEMEYKEVFGITFAQKRNDQKISNELLENIVTENKELPSQIRRDLLISLIVLKYTQSNSVCYVKDGQAIGIGAGQQSRIHCTRLAGEKADKWWFRHHEKVLSLPFLDNVGRADRDNAIDVYLSDEVEDLLRPRNWEHLFFQKPEPLSQEESRDWKKAFTNVVLGSDAFFPFGDNIERAVKSGVHYIAQPGGSLRDDQVIETCNRHKMVMCFTGIRLFHH
ncbi:MAG: phosphoribosylaminoimidazolecarboxamide formyltransferase [Clostridiales bacterium]|nr:phosphoribosylaminoimidazolecarboxamide formyltransferase [Clostridiales bacterium]